MVFKRIRNFIKCEGFKCLAIIFWLVINVYMFWRKFWTYKTQPQYQYLYKMLGDSLCWSRGTAAVLCLNCGLVLLPMCRNIVSLVRSSTFLSRGIKRLLDNSRGFHILCGVIIFISAAIHTVAHIINARRFSTNFCLEFPELNAAAFPNQDPLQVMACSLPGITGFLMVIVLVLMMTSSTRSVRSNGYELFWYTHHLFVVFFLLLFLHGLGGMIKEQVDQSALSILCKSTSNATDYSQDNKCEITPTFQADKSEVWMWILLPLLIYIIDRVVRFVRSKKLVKVVQVNFHHCDVVELKLQKQNFAASPGQFIYIKCSDISNWEWHPFTLTSCPVLGQDNFSIHFKILGDWTRSLANKLGRYDPQRIPCVVSWPDLNTQSLSPRIQVDGPYGSPCEDVFQYSVCMCIAAGIGVTPFAAIFNKLRLVLKHHQEQNIKLRRMYFIWVCRKVGSFHWMMRLIYELFNEICEMNRPDFLVCRFYVTGSRRESTQTFLGSEWIDMRKWIDKRLTYGKPDWKEMFRTVTEQNPRSNVGVFYCGPREISSTLHHLCLNSHNFTTTFQFNEETLS